MVRNVFFSFHYERDIKRIGQIRNSWVTKPDLKSAGFIDAASWESIKRQGTDAVKKWIADQLNGTSVTVVLIGAETSEREWVAHEILESYKRGNALLGIYIHNVVDLDRKTDIKGKNPFDNFVVKNNSGQINLSQLCETYDWVNDDGYNNLGKWIEAAVKERQNWSDGELIELKSVRQAIPNTNATFASSKVNEDIKPQAPWSY